MSGRPRSAHHGGGGRHRDDHRHHPYPRHSNSRHHSHSTSNNYGRRDTTRRISTIQEAMKSDALLTKDDFLRIAKPTDSDLDGAYEDYVKQHQREFLCRFYAVHGKDPWLMALYPQLLTSSESSQSSESNNNHSSNSNSSGSNNSNGDTLIQTRVDYFITNCLKHSHSITLDTNHHQDLIADSRVSVGNQGGDGVRILQTSRRMPTALAILNSCHDDMKQLYINNIPPNASATHLLSIIKETVPTAVQLVLSNPVPSRGFCRSGWLAIKSDDDDADNDKESVTFPEVRILDGLSFSSATLSFYPKDPHRRIKLVSGKFADPDRIRRDLHISQELITSMNVSRGIAFDMSEFAAIADERLRLDLQIMFLRVVHWVCYYSAYEAACPEELTRHCGDIVLRDDHIDSDDLTVFDKKIQLLIDRGYRSLAIPPITLTDRLTTKYCQQLEAERWKCAACAKLFKGHDFLLKHITTKHEDLVAQDTKDLAALNAILELPHFLLIPNSMIVRPAGPLRRYTRPPAGSGRRPSFSAGSGSGTSIGKRHHYNNNTHHPHKPYVDLDAVRQSDSIDISYDL